MEKKVYSWRNPRPAKANPEFGASITVPDQTMSMRTILDRYRRGMPLEIRQKEPLFYNGEFPDLSKMDISEIHQLKKEAAAEVQRMQKELQDKEEYKRMQKQKELEQQLEDLKKQMAGNTPPVDTTPKNDS